MELSHYISQAQRGNQQAFSFLLNAFWSDVYNYQLKRLVNQDDAEDITIQTFARAFDKIHSYNPQYGFKTWLITLSKNISIDTYRSQKREMLPSEPPQKVAYSLPDEAPTIEDALIQEQQLSKLLLQIKKLTPQYQQIIHLRFFQELSYKDIAQQLHISVSNVKVSLLRAKQQLAQIINSDASP